jgi:DNA-directed RNA polymerase sigma subunit (sigma70/sigma32)
MGASFADYLVARFQGEVFGESLFGGLARRTSDEAAREKWRALEQLERRTKERIRPALQRLGLPADEDPARSRQGEALAARLSAIPWTELIRSMRPEFEKFVRAFEEAEWLAPAEEKALARHITEHERALLEFAELELAGGGSDPLAPIRPFLA